VDSSFADAAKTMMDTCTTEIEDIRTCRDCYKRLNADPKEEDWFSLPCKPSHEIVVVQVKTFSPWPAKVVDIYYDFLSGMKTQLCMHENSTNQRNYGFKFLKKTRKLNFT
jgi:hypothetical protein